jgi:hypothetical protein
MMEILEVRISFCPWYCCTTGKVNVLGSDVYI